MTKKLFLFHNLPLPLLHVFPSFSGIFPLPILFVIPQICICAYILGQRRMEDNTSSDSVKVDSEKSSSEEMTAYRCEYCGTAFRKHAKYIRHLRTHTKEVIAIV